MRNRKNYFLKGINWPLIGVDRFSAKYTPYDVINNKAANSIHFQSKIDKNLFAYLNSKVYNALLLMINPTVNYPLSNIASSPYVEVDFDFSDIVDECLEISKEDYDSFEYSSDFKRHFLCTKIGNWKIKELYNSWEEKIMQQRSISHEYRNNLLYMSALLEQGDYGKLSDYLKEVSGADMRGMDVINTNNSVINVIMNTKYYEAKKAGASFICKINNLSGITMKETDIILLLSNLLNNAIEAVQKCLCKRVIKVKIVIENNKFIMSVRNTFNGEIKKDGDKFKTTKKEKSELHGIGIKNVIRIVEKYHGLHLFETCEDEICAVVIIPMDIHNSENKSR